VSRFSRMYSLKLADRHRWERVVLNALPKSAAAVPPQTLRLRRSHLPSPSEKSIHLDCAFGDDSHRPEPDRHFQEKPLTPKSKELASCLASSRFVTCNFLTLVTCSFRSRPRMRCRPRSWCWGRPRRLRSRRRSRWRWRHRWDCRRCRWRRAHRRNR
jgi:hypothetical protein